jgi:hypothetical protein
MGGVASYIVDVGTHYHVTCCFRFNARLMGYLSSLDKRKVISLLDATLLSIAASGREKRSNKSASALSGPGV